MKNDDPNQIQKLKPEWRLNWAIIRILCNDFLCPPSQAEWTFPSIHHRHKENQVLTTCTQSAPSHNLVNHHSNVGQEHLYNTCTLTPCAQLLRYANASTWVLLKYLHSDTAHGHMVCRWLLGTEAVSETSRFIFLFSSLVLSWEHLMSQQLLQHPLVQAGRHLGRWVTASQFKQEILTVCSCAPHKVDRNNSNNNNKFASAFLPLVSVAGGLCSA